MKTRRPLVRRKLIRRLILERGWTIDDAARKAGVSPSTLYKLTCGARPTLPVARKVAEALGLKLADVVMEEPAPGGDAHP